MGSKKVAPGGHSCTESQLAGERRKALKVSWREEPDTGSTTRVQEVAPWGTPAGYPAVRTCRFGPLTGVAYRVGPYSRGFTPAVTYEVSFEKPQR
jgi:hypothetical protein